MMVIPCFFLREKTARSYQRFEETMGQKEGMERVGHRLHNGRTCFFDRAKDCICQGNVADRENQRCTRRRSIPDTCLPCASPYLSRTIVCLLSHPPSLSGKTRKIVAQYSRYVVFQAQND